MAFVIADRVRETSTTAGTGSITLAGAVIGYQAFSAVLATGDTTYYTIADQAGANWEVGIGTFTSPSTLARTTILSSSNAGSIVTFTSSTKDVFISLPSSKTNVEDQPNIIEVNSSSNALRITQTGAGNALVVEDSANPDATPFVVDANGRALSGATSSYAGIFGNAGNVQISSTSLHGLQSGRFANDIFGSDIQLLKSRSATIGAQTILQSGDTIANFLFGGSDGVAFIPAATITAAVDGTPGTNDMPGRLVFSTTPDGASSPTERMRIDNAGSVGIGTTPAAGRNFVIGKNITGSTTSRGVTSIGQIQSDVTGAASYFATAAGTANATFTLSSLQHYIAIQGGFGALSTVTNQIGFYVDPSLIGATTNIGFYSDNTAGVTTGKTSYGFYSAVNTATGGGTTWGFYAGGTANNFFGGATTISVNSASDALRITQTGAGNAILVEDSANPDSTPLAVDANGVLIVGNTVSQGTVPLGDGARYTPQTQIQGNAYGTSGISATLFNSAAAAGGGSLALNKSNTTTIGGQAAVVNGDVLGTVFFNGSDGTNFVRGAQILAAVDGTPGTNDMPGRLVFSTTADGSSSPTERMRIDSAGNVGIGVTPGATTRLDVYSSGTTSTVIRTRNDTTSVYLDANNGYSYLNTFSNHPMLFGTNNTERMRIDNAGNVGIGTSSPGTYGKLSVYGAGYVGSSAQSSDASGVIVALAANSSSEARLNVLSNHPLTFWTNNTERMRIDSSGLVGIGTSSPTEKLFVSGGNIGIQRTASDYSILTINNTSGVQVHLNANANTEGNLRTVTNHPLSFSTNNTERMRIDSSGNVGIGTSSPAAKFDLAGSYKEGVVTANTGTTYTITLTSGTLQILTLTGSCTFTFPTPTAGFSFTLFLKQDATGGRAATWPATVKWPSSTAPTITSTASKGDKYVFTADGTYWWGSTAGQNYL